MPHSHASLLRSYALRVLADVSSWPHLDKERLFAESMDFYRWLLANTQDASNLDVYSCEFYAHHAGLMRGLPRGLQDAAFITWFVENRFHLLPLLGPLVTGDEGEAELELLRKTRFSSPCFRLPTETPHDGYLTQWLVWHLAHLPARRHTPDPTTLHRWARGQLALLPEESELNREALLTACCRFFAWCRAHLDSWEPIRGPMHDFSGAFPELLLLAQNEWDAHFILWFVGCVLPGLDLLEEDAS